MYPKRLKTSQAKLITAVAAIVAPVVFVILLQIVMVVSARSDPQPPRHAPQETTQTVPAPAAAPLPTPRKYGLNSGLWTFKPLSDVGVWQMALIHDLDYAKGCSAQWRIGDEGGDMRGTIVDVVMSSSREFLVYIAGWDFGIPADTVMRRGLIQVDGGDVVEIFARKRMPEGDLHFVVPNPNPNLMAQIKKGKEVAVVVGERKLTLPLKDTTKMMAAMDTCLASAQATVDRDRVHWSKNAQKTVK